MKTKKLFLILLSMVLAATLSVFAFACSSQETTVLTIDSKTEATIEIGQEYTLVYTCAGTVTVTASGGTYDESTRKFSAEEAGTYTLTVVGVEEGKAEATATVTITVVPAADKTALQAAMSKANALIESDYTEASWSALRQAKNNASRLLTNGGTQAEVDGAAQDLEYAITNLKPAAINKVNLTDESKIVFNDTTYFAEDYENFTEIKEQIAALDDDESIKLNSQYAAKVEEILEGLVKDAMNITVSGAPEGKMFVSKLSSYTMTAEVGDGVDVTWKINDEQVGTGKTYTYEPTEFGVPFKIEAIASKDGSDNTKTATFNGEFVETYYSVNVENGIKVENDVIKVTESFEWGGGNEGKKVTVPDVVLSGDFTVYFDLKFTEARGGANVMALFLLDENGSETAYNWIAVCQHTNKLEIAFNANNKPQVDMPAGTVDVGNTMHFMLARRIEGGKTYYTAALLDDNGRVLTLHNQEDKNSTFTGKVTLGINAEHASFEVSNISVDKDATIVYNKSALHSAINAAQYKEMDYTAESYEAYSDTLAAANIVYNNKNATQEIIDGAVEGLKEACSQLDKVDVVPATTTENSFTYNNVTYNSTDYKNILGEGGILAQVNNLNDGADDMLVSEYDEAIKALIEQLIPSLDVKVSGVPEGTLLVNQLLPYTLTATPEGADSVTWTVNGEEVTTGVSDDGLTYTFTPEEFNTEYQIAVTVAKSGSDITPVTKTFTSSFFKAGYTVHENYTDKIKVENNVVDVYGSGTGWDAEKGRKVVLKNLNLHGEFVVTMDIEFKTNAIMGLFLVNLDGENDGGRSHYIVINNGSQFMGIGINQAGGEPHYGIPNGVVSNGTKFTLKVSRYEQDGRWYLKGEVIDSNGNVVTSDQRDGCRSENIALGIQSETGTFTVSNIALVSGTIIDRNVINEVLGICGEFDAKNNPDKVDLTINFNNDNGEVTNYVAARKAMWDNYCFNANATPAEITAALEAYTTALEALKEVKIDVDTVKAATDTDNHKFTYDEKEYTALYYTNIDAVIADIDGINGDTYEYVTDYQEAIKPLLAKLKLALDVTITAVNGSNNAVTNNSVILSWADNESYTLTASGAIAADPDATFTYAWRFDGEDVAGTTSTYALTATQGTHVVEAFLTYGEGDEQMTVSKTFTIAFEKANVATHENVTNNNDGTFTANTGIGWGGDWEGRKVVFNELVFNGSFSAQMDVTFTTKQGATDANVVTIHLLNADTLSRDSGRDKAVVGYGCICLHENPVRLETGGNALRKIQSNGDDKGGNWEAINPSMISATNAGKFGTGATFTVKLDVYRTQDEKVSYDFSVLVDGNWITLTRDDWGGNYGGGFIVGVNIENAGVTLSNFQFTLMDEGTRGSKDYVAGSVQSKADLYNKYVEYKDVDASNYVNGGEFVNAYYAAYEELCNNTATADYATALANLVAAYEALVEATDVTVTVDGLDSGYNNYRGYDKFTAVVPEDASDVKWTYNFLAADAEEGTLPTETTVNGADLTLAAGAYSNVTLTFTVDETEYTYTYQDFTIAALGLKVGDATKNDGKADRINIKDDGSVDMSGISWDVPLEQLVLDGLRPHEFEFSVDVTYISGDVITFRLSERDVRMVVRFSSHGMQIGFDENGDGGYVTVNGGFTSGETYTFKITAIKNDLGEYVITFSAYNAAGTKIAEKVRPNNVGNQHFDDRSTRTEFNITDENVNCTFSNFRIMYN